MDTPQANALGLRGNTWAARLAGLVPSAVHKARVAIIGCGSVGSFVAEELLRAGVSDFLLIDPDIVEWPNLTRTVYGHGDVGQPKVEALCRRLASIFPDVHVVNHQAELQSFQETFACTFKNIDLVVAAVDDPKANGMLDRYCYALKIPCVFIGIYKGAKGGEVIVVEPEFTPCFGCATGGVRESLADVTDSTLVQRDRDYGSNKLVAEIALGCDIHFVCTAGVKICLSLLSRSDGSASLMNFMKTQIEEGVHYLMLGMEPDYYIFASTHAQTIGQHAFQSLWLKTTRREECPRCGSFEFREPPL